MNHRISSPSFPLTPKEKSAVPNTEANIQTGDNVRIITAQFSFYIKNMNSAAETYYLTNVMHQNGWQTWWSYTYIVVPPIYSLADTGLSLWLIQSTCKVAGQCERSDKIGKIKSYILAFKYDTVTEIGDNWRELCSWGQWPIHKPALLPMVISYHTQEIKKTSAV